MATEEAAYGCQVRLIASLRDLAGPVPAGFFSHREFFIVALRRLETNLDEFKAESLRALAAGLLERLRRGPLSQADIAAFKDALDKLVSGRDFMYASAGLTGSRELIAERLSRLRPLSMPAEERKRPGEPRDSGAERLTGEAYRQLGFPALEAQAARGLPADALLRRARELVGEYCALYRLPVSPQDTLPPFSLSRIDAVTGACYRLLGRLKDHGAA